jgi:hypothetical protein
MGWPRGSSDFAEWSGHLISRISRQAALTGDPGPQELFEKLSQYPGVSAERHVDGSEPLLMHRLRLADQDLSFFSTVTTYGTVTDITFAELTFAAFHPADAKTKEYLVSTSS